MKACLECLNISLLGKKTVVRQYSLNCWNKKFLILEYMIYYKLFMYVSKTKISYVSLFAVELLKTVKWLTYSFSYEYHLQYYTTMT